MSNSTQGPNIHDWNISDYHDHEVEELGIFHFIGTMSHTIKSQLDFRKYKPTYAA
jgi:hypothetical protein